MTVTTHPQTHKRPNLHPSLTPFWNPTFHRRQPNPVPLSPYLASLLLLLLYILFFWAMTVDCGIFIWLIMSIGCSWFVEWVAKIWCGYRGFGYKFDVKIVVVVRVGYLVQIWCGCCCSVSCEIWCWLLGLSLDCSSLYLYEQKILLFKSLMVWVEKIIS